MGLGIARVRTSRYRKYMNNEMQIGQHVIWNAPRGSVGATIVKFTNEGTRATVRFDVPIISITHTYSGTRKGRADSINRLLSEFEVTK